METPQTVADVRAMLKGLAEADAPAEPQGIAFLQDAGYDEMNVGAAREYIAGLSDTEQAIALEYERRNRNRSGVLGAFD